MNDRVDDGNCHTERCLSLSCPCYVEAQRDGVKQALRNGTVDPRERTLELHDQVCDLAAENARLQGRLAFAVGLLREFHTSGELDVAAGLAAGCPTCTFLLDEICPVCDMRMIDHEADNCHPIGYP